MYLTQFRCVRHTSSTIRNTWLPCPYHSIYDINQKMIQLLNFQSPSVDIESFEVWVVDSWLPWYRTWWSSLELWPGNWHWREVNICYNLLVRYRYDFWQTADDNAIDFLKSLLCNSESFEVYCHINTMQRIVTCLFCIRAIDIENSLHYIFQAVRVFFAHHCHLIPVILHSTILRGTWNWVSKFMIKVYPHFSPK